MTASPAMTASPTEPVSTGGFWARLRRLAQDDFLRNNAGYFVLSMVTAVLSYLFHPVMARLITLSEYGEVMAIQSLFMNLSVGLGVFGSIATNIIANSDDHDHADRQARTELLGQLRSLLTVAVITVLVAVVSASGWISSFLNLTSPVAVIMLSASYLLGIGILFRRSFLRGTRQFGRLGVTQILESGARVVFCGLFAWLGFSVIGVVGGMLAVQALLLVNLFLMTRARFDAGRIGRPTLSPAVRRELRFGVLILAVSAALTFLSTADVIVVKHYFSPDVAGAYSGISTVAHIVLFVSGSVVSVLATSVRIKQAPRVNQLYLAKTLALATLLGGGALLVMAAAPEFFVRLFVGERFVAGAGWFAPMALLMFLLALANPVFSYYLALRQRFVGWLGLGGVAVILGLCVVRHDSPGAIIVNFNIGVLLTLAAFVARWAAVAVKYRLYVRS